MRCALCSTLLLLSAFFISSLQAPHPPIVTLAYDRGAALSRFLDSILAAGADPSLVWVFQDGNERSVEQAVSSFPHVKLVRIPPPLQQNESSVLTSRLTFNYKFMLNYAFSSSVLLPAPADYVIVMEDDLVVAPDTVNYFSSLTKVLDKDDSVFCVSSYNDNAFWSTSRDESKLLRGEHFMALGWMTSRKIFENDIKNSWPDEEVWDTTWASKISSPPASGQSKIRECVFPEVPRTIHPGDPATRGGALTTSRILQRLHFDHIRLAKTLPPLSPRSVSLRVFDDDLIQTLRDAHVVKCPQAALSALPTDESLSSEHPVGKRAPAVVLIDAKDDRDEIWDVAMNLIQMFGRGPGLDRLPRGIHKGVVRTYFAGRELLFMGASSPLRNAVPDLRKAHAATTNEIKECAEEAVREAPTVFDASGIAVVPVVTIFETGNSTCEELCGEINQQCDIAVMSLANTCSRLNKISFSNPQGDPSMTPGGVRYWKMGSGDESAEDGCDGCSAENSDPDRAYGASVHSPGWREDTAECVVASWAALSCFGREPPFVTMKACGCV